MINAINVSTEGIDITGSKLTLNGDTVFSSNCEIYGNLKLTKTSSNSERIEIGSFNGDEEIRCYGNDHLGVRIGTDEFGGTSQGYIELNGQDYLAIGGTYGWNLYGWYIYPSADASFALPNAANKAKWYLGSGNVGAVGWNHTNHELLIRENSNDYVFTPDQLGDHIQDASAATGNPANLNEAVTKTDFNALKDKFNTLLQRCEAAKILANS